MRIKSTKDDSTRDIDIHGLFIAIGHKPNTDIFQGQLDMAGGYIKVKSSTEGNATATSVAGCLPPATSWTTCAVRRSPRPAPGVWRRWMPRKYLDALEQKKG